MRRIAWYRGRLVEVVEGSNYLTDCLKCVIYRDCDKTRSCNSLIRYLLGIEVYDNSYVVTDLAPRKISLYLSKYLKNNVRE